VNLYAARHREPVPALARWLLALGIVATLAANMAQGWSHGPVGAVIAAWPAVSLAGSYELLVWLIRTSAAPERGQRKSTAAKIRHAAVELIAKYAAEAAARSPGGGMACTYGAGSAPQRLPPGPGWPP
jgi:hypothetical protein